MGPGSDNKIYNFHASEHFSALSALRLELNIQGIILTDFHSHRIGWLVEGQDLKEAGPSSCLRAAMIHRI